MYVFNPRDYDAEIGDRFIIYDDNSKKVFKRIIINSEENIEVKYNLVLNNVDNYKFKFQKRVDGSWKDSHRYFKLIKSHQLGDYWSDNIKLTKNSLINYITYYTYTSTSYSRTKFLQSFKQVCEDLWLRHQKKHTNLKMYFKFVNENKELFNLEWQNINIYLLFLHNLKAKFQEYGYNNLYFYELQPELLKNNEILKFINGQIKVLNQKNLQFSKLLIAQYYSLLNNRAKAVEYFKLVRSYNNNMEIDFLVGQGSATYNLLDGKNYQKHTSDIKFNSEKYNSDTNYTILCSVDSKYLKRYGTIIFYTVIALQKYHFHIHVVGDDKTTNETIEEAQSLFNQIKLFIGKESDIIFPTFSREELPTYANSLKSFSATARFINASYFMDKFNSSLLILDADMFLTDDLTKYLNVVKKYDVALAFSKSITTTLPWRRLMAGNIFLTNNEKAKKFIDLTKNYIVDNLKEEKSWTLDQNALSYAYENIFDYYPNIVFGNTYEIKGPFAHPQIRTYIERK